MTKNFLRPLLAVTFLSLVVLACREPGVRQPAVYCIPKGYVGWVRVEFNVKGAPELPTKWFQPQQYYWFPESGLLRTSSQLYQGAASAEFDYYVGKELTKLPDNISDRGGVMSGLISKPDGSPIGADFITFFIGTAEDYAKHKDELERYRVGEYKYVMDGLDKLPRVGNLAANAPSKSP